MALVSARSKLVPPARAAAGNRPRPVLIGVVGDSAAGKTTLTNGLISIFGPHRVAAMCTDDYHRYDRQERKKLAITPLHPDCNYIEIMEQHLLLLAAGQPILKPVYGHAHGTLEAPELFEPREFVVIEGLLAYHTKAMRDCFDVKVYLDPPEDLRRKWKVQRDCSKRGYEPAEVLADLERREPDSEAFIRPQRQHADIVVRFHPPGSSLDVDPALLSVRLVLRPTLPHPYLIDIAQRTRVDHENPIRLSLARDSGKPVDVLEVEGGLDPGVSATVEQVIWESMALDEHSLDRNAIGLFQDGERLRRSETLAITQLLLVAQLCGATVSD
jgi:phosphoribulokinase